MAVTINPPRDPNTLSNYNNFTTTHTKTNLKIDFEKRNLSGNVTLMLRSITNSEAKEIVLDTSHLDIEQVFINGKDVDWRLLPRFEPYGSALTIKLDEGVPKGQEIEAKIAVSTTLQCTALQWLTPAQTSNKKHPYMFSQCQAIHARSLFPCQDTPDVKSVYEFRIQSPLPVVASGLLKNVEPAKEGDSEDQVYTFKQENPIPSYLFALASGDITSASIGPRSTVFTGPDELAAAKWELERDTERFIQVAEGIIYPYAWQEYNVLVLPPSFPYGGMENPVVTFATPTIISGDRENVDVIAHELAHSWSGNLVSNASWEHFWLNEGWTMYLERRIQAAIHGEPHRDFSAIIGWKALADSIKLFGEDHEFTKLVIDLKGKDPDDAFSSIPYEKGFTFLYHLEKLLSMDKWDKFIVHYFTKYQKKSVDSYEFKATLLDFFDSDPAASKTLADLDWDSWFYRPGFPPKPDFDTSLVDVCYKLADRWLGLSNAQNTDFKPSKDDISDWTANQVVVFLERLQDSESPLPKEHIELMGERYGLAQSKNVEVVSRYFGLGLRSKDEAVYEPTSRLLGQVGRMKFVRPLYRQLNEVDRSLAIKTFEKNKDFYHPICRGLVDKDLFGNPIQIMTPSPPLPTGKYPAKSHAKKVVEYLKSEVPDAAGVLYLEGQKTRMIEDNDEPQPFRQRRYFYYLTGCPLPDCYFTYDIATSTSTLFIPPIDPDEIIWSGLPLSPEDALERYEVDAVRSTIDVNSTLSSLASPSSPTVYAITNQVSDRITFLSFESTDVTHLKSAIEHARITKTPYEVAITRHANAVSTIAHTAVLRACKHATNEQELEALFLQRCIAAGCREQAYHSIVASGENAATLHYQKNNEPFAGRLNLLLDAGAESRCYASDITRTFPLSGRFTTESRAIYDIVLRMQEECTAKLRAGILWDDVHAHAHRVAIDGLLRLGLLKGASAEELFQARTSVAFFPHGLGHYLGMDTHDVGGQPNYEDKDPMFKYLRLRTKLPAGSIVTVEPGIYFCRFIITPYLSNPSHADYIDKAVLERYWSVGGVRIEDNVLITDDGHENLTTAVKDVAEMERLIGEGEEGR
ncbi:MAG: hypothetical protein M1833_006069 [Piccolia ochrophora]|nr:MAG: hypothetical protein M1833_006069 [Piccolia ochrophora]